LSTNRDDILQSARSLRISKLQTLHARISCGNANPTIKALEEEHPPDFIGKQDEPDDVKEKRKAQEPSISPTQALTTTFDRNQGEQCECQIGQQNARVQSSQRSH
jgi:hypothetical protein